MLLLISVLFCIFQTNIAFNSLTTVADDLSEMDANIVNLLAEAAKEKALRICDTITRYNYMLSGILDKFKEINNSKVAKVVPDIWMRGRPRFTEFNDFSELNHWSYLSVNMLRKLISNANKLWNEFRIVCEQNIKPGALNTVKI